MRRAVSPTQSRPHIRPSRWPAPIFLFTAVLLAISGLTARAIIALGTEGLLDWDETYYASTTATAAHGLGRFPYVDGYPTIPAMGGVGYVVFLYVLAYELLGPHLFGLRLVSFLMSVLAACGLTLLTGRLHGSAAGFAALALVPSILLFQLSNSIRLDVFAIAFVTWALVLYLHVAGRSSLRWHVLLGLVLALGLQVHLHTAVAASAMGFAYLTAVVGARARGTPDGRRHSLTLAGFVAGYAAGVLLFIAVNVRPDPTGYFRTAALARLSTADSPSQLNLTARMDRARLAQTFFSPALIIPKEAVRYSRIFSAMPTWEKVLWLVALPAYVLRRRIPHRFRGRALQTGALLGSAILFNGSSPLYASAILPFFVPAIATLLTHGFGRRERVELDQVPVRAVVLLVLASIAIAPALVSSTSAAIGAIRRADTEAAPAVVGFVKSVASTGCVLAGPTELYALHFMDYPRFVGTREVEVLIGSTYYDLQDQLGTYWRIKAPDIVFGPAANGLAGYLADAGYLRLTDGVWRKPDRLSPGCAITIR